MVTSRPRRVSKAGADRGGMFWFLGSIDLDYCVGSREMLLARGVNRWKKFKIGCAPAEFAWLSIPTASWSEKSSDV